MKLASMSECNNGPSIQSMMDVWLACTKRIEEPPQECVQELLAEQNVDILALPQGKIAAAKQRRVTSRVCASLCF